MLDCLICNVIPCLAVTGWQTGIGSIIQNYLLCISSTTKPNALTLPSMLIRLVCSRCFGSSGTASKVFLFFFLFNPSLGLAFVKQEALRVFFHCVFRPVWVANRRTGKTSSCLKHHRIRSTAHAHPPSQRLGQNFLLYVHFCSEICSSRHRLAEGIFGLICVSNVPAPFMLQPEAEVLYLTHTLT